MVPPSIPHLVIKKQNFWSFACNFFVWKDFNLIFLSEESWGPGDDLRDITCQKTPPSHKVRSRQSQKVFALFSKNRQILLKSYCKCHSFTIGFCECGHSIQKFLTLAGPNFATRGSFLASDVSKIISRSSAFRRNKN